MTRKLLNVCVLFVLLTGCWGGVLAAALCPHRGCEMTNAASGISSTQSNHGNAHCHDASTSAAESDRFKAHAEHFASQTHGGARPFGLVEFKIAVGRDREGGCAHCVGNPDAPPSSALFEQGTDSFRKNRDFTAPLAEVQAGSPSPVFRQKIKPAQHAPPGRSDKHLLLLNVFRI